MINELPEQVIASGTLLELHLIGEMRARFPGGASVLPVGRKTRALLAIAALMAPRPALRGRIAELLWSRRPEEQARASLRQEVHRLMETLAPHGESILQVTRDHIAMRPDAAWVDVAEVLSASPENPAALSRLDGELLEGLEGLDPGFDTWLTTERERLRDRGRAVAEKVLSGDMEPEEAIPAAQRLLQIDRAHEGAWRALMRAHAARGERGMAIQAYDRCRTALADLLDAAPSVETQRLLSEIRGPFRRPATAEASAAVELPAEFALPGPARGGAHVGLMPLALVGGDAADADLAHGLSEELAAALARFRWIYVVAPGSLARYAGSARDDSAIRRVFGLHFLLEGSVHRAGGRVRVSLRLLDLQRPGQIVWTGRFDRTVENRLDLEEQVAGEAAARIETAVLDTASRQAPADSGAEPGGYATMLRALPLLQRVEAGSFREAGKLLRRAMLREPDLAPAHAWRALWRAVTETQRWTDLEAESHEDAASLASRVAQLDPSDARALTAAGHLRAVVLREIDEAAALHDRALALNPNLGMAWALSAATLAFQGQLDEAAHRAARYKRLTPSHPWAAWLDPAIGLIALLKRDFAGAAQAARSLVQISPGSRLGLEIWLSAAGHLGRPELSASLFARLNAMKPGITLSAARFEFPFSRSEDREVFEEGLRLAGVPER